MKALVGLGNPGPEYELTRHNVGFLALMEAARLLGFSAPRRQFKGMLMEGWVAGQKVALFMPHTFMNLSGEALLALKQWYKLEPEDIMVFSDDIDLDPGMMRIRQKGGAGTHNGWRSILQVTGSQDYPRARIGIGAPPQGWDLKDWVLSRWDKSPQAADIQAAITLAAKAGICFVEQGITLAMNRYNITSRPKKVQQQEAQPVKDDKLENAKPTEAIAEHTVANPPKPQGSSHAG